MARCSVDSSASPQFAIYKEHWRKRGYPSVDKDVEAAFQVIAENVDACHAKPMAGFSDVLDGMKLLRYRYKNSHAREGASGGWRIMGLFDGTTLFPIMLFPKKEMPDAPADAITKCVKELTTILLQRHLPETAVVDGAEAQ